MTHAFDPCTHPGRHGYTLPGEPEYPFCERCRRLEGAQVHREPATCDVCRVWGMPHPQGCQRPAPVALTPDPTPTFEQSDKAVRLGSEVLLVYPAGDCDVALVTGLERFGRTVYVAVPGQLPQSVDVGALAPFEAEDLDDEACTGEVIAHDNGTTFLSHSRACPAHPDR